MTGGTWQMRGKKMYRPLKNNSRYQMSIEKPFKDNPRYMITYQWVGKSKPYFVARFGDDLLGECPTRDGALILCRAHSDKRKQASLA